MNQIQQHIIRRNTLKVSAVTSDGVALQQKLSTLMNGEVLTRMSELFDKLADKNEWLIIDRMDVQLDCISEDDLDTDFTAQLLRKIEAQIIHKRDQITTGAVHDADVAVILSPQEKTLQAFLFFLEKGILPWWFEITAHVDFEKQLVSALIRIQTFPGVSVEYYFQQFKKILASETAAIRLAEQFSEEVFESVLIFLSHQADQANVSAHKESLNTIFKELSSLIITRIATRNIPDVLASAKSSLIMKISMASRRPETLTADWISEILSHLAHPDSIQLSDAIMSNSILKKYIHDNYTPSEVRQDFKKSGVDIKILRGKKDNKVNVSEKLSEIKRDIESLEGIMVRNAGLVIVTPFLSQLFTECGIFKDNEITDIDKAIGLLHYIVWGNTEYREYDTALSKVICNADSSFHIRLIDKILPVYEDNINEMLSSIIRYWTVLKNTSVDGLRESFLQRKGRLCYKYDNWFLQVEQNSIDVLLQSLPWTIGFIKLPWMNTMLKTEWN